MSNKNEDLFAPVMILAILAFMALWHYISL